MSTHELVRTRDDRLIAGVCSGLGHRFGISPWLARVLFLFVPGPNVLVYIVLWILMPEEAEPVAAATLELDEG